MVIRKNPKTGKYYIAPSPPSFYKSKPKPSDDSSGGSSSGGRTVPSDFVGPLQPGTTREAPKTVPSDFVGPLRPGTIREPAPIKKPSRGGGRTVPYDFVGPIQQGTTRAPAPTPQPGDYNFVGPLQPGTTRAPAPEKTVKLIKTDKNIGSINRYSSQYKDSLTTTKDAGLSVQAYGGVSLPYGETDMKWFEPQFGTITPEYSTGFKEVSLIGSMKEQEFFNPDISKPTDVIIGQTADKLSKKISEEEVAKSEKVLNDSVKKIQDKIDSGEISLKRGEEAIKKIQETENKKLNIKIKARYDKELKDTLSSKEFSSKIGSAEKFRGSYKDAFTSSGELGKLELGADVAAGVVSGIAPPVGIAYFAGKGFYKAAKGADEDIRMIDVSPSGELITPRYMGLIPSEQSREAGMSFLFAGASGLGYVSKIGKDITALRKAEILEKPWTVTSKDVFKVGDESWIKASGSKSIGGASAEGTSLLKIKTGEKGAFNILGSRGKVDVRVVDFMKQGVVKSGDDIIKSSTKYSTFGRGSVSDKIYPNIKLGITQGEGYVTPDMWQDVKLLKTYKKSPFWSNVLGRDYGTVTTDIKGTYVGDKVSLFDFGGVSRKVGDKTFFSSGRFTGAKLNLKTGGITGKFKPEAWGSTLPSAVDDVASKGYSSFSASTGGGKSSKTFLSNMFKPDIVTETVSPQIIGKQFAGQSFSAAQPFASQGLKITSSVVPSASTTSLVGASTLIKPTTKPIIDISPTIDVTGKANIITALTPKINMGIKSITKPSTSFATARVPIVSTKSGQDFISATAQKSGQKLSRATAQSSSITSAFPSSSLFAPTPGVTGFGFNIPIPRWGGKQAPIAAIEKKKQGYIPEARTKGGKWIKLSGKPMSRTAALSRASRAADQTLSAQFRIKKAKGKITGNGDNYFGITKNKYRPYKIRKGKKVELVNHFVEKRGKRLDTRGEKKGIKLAKYAKQQGWLTPTKPKKNKKGVKKKKSPWLI